ATRTRARALARIAGRWIAAECALKTSCAHLRAGASCTAAVAPTRLKSRQGALSSMLVPGSATRHANGSSAEAKFQSHARRAAPTAHSARSGSGWDLTVVL